MALYEKEVRQRRFFCIVPAARLWATIFFPVLKRVVFIFALFLRLDILAFFPFERPVPAGLQRTQQGSIHI